MSLSFNSNVLFCHRPHRILRMMVDLFEATYFERNGQLMVDLDGTRFTLKELPKNDHMELRNHFVPQMSFYLTTNDRDLLNDFKERFEFFLFKENHGHYVRERMSRVVDNEKEGIVLFDDDGRSWNIMYEANCEKYSQGPALC